MEKNVNYAEYAAALIAFRAFVKAQYGVGVYELPLHDGLAMPVKLGVNWPAKGTVSVAEARDFAAQLLSAADAVQSWEYNGYMVTAD